MSRYKHITPTEREKILILRSRNHSITYIADSVGRDKSTVSRELSRNTINGEYSAAAAQVAYCDHSVRRRRKTKLSENINGRQSKLPTGLSRSILTSSSAIQPYIEVYTSDCSIPLKNANPMVIKALYENSGTKARLVIPGITLKNEARSSSVMILRIVQRLPMTAVVLATGKAILQPDPRMVIVS